MHFGRKRTQRAQRLTYSLRSFAARVYLPDTDVLIVSAYSSNGRERHCQRNEIDVHLGHGTERNNSNKTNERVTNFDPVADSDFFLRNKELLLRNFSGRFVAIRNEQIVVDPEDYFTLYWRLCEIYGEPVSAYIRHICPASFDSMGTEPAYLLLQVGETKPC